MPTYEYKCDACGHAFERVQSIMASPIRKCPKCGRLKVKRLLGTGVGLIFKGSGFYTTDYRSESYKTAAKADNGSAAGAGKPSESASGSKASDKPSGPAKTTASPGAGGPSKASSGKQSSGE